MKLILASQSPRRRELLARMGLEFQVISPKIDEDAIHRADPRELVEALSRAKAGAVEAEPEALVIAADTVVVLEGRVLGKPASPAQAEEMLAALSGRSHQVFTGYTLRRGEKVLTGSEETQVTFRPLGREEIRAYVATGEPMDKAGAYGIQGLGGLLVEGIRGDYSNVVGLPVCALGLALRDFGVDCLALAGGKDRSH